MIKRSFVKRKQSPDKPELSTGKRFSLAFHGSPQLRICCDPPLEPHTGLNGLCSTLWVADAWKEDSARVLTIHRLALPSSLRKS